MTSPSYGQVTLLPAQLGRLAELFPEGPAVGISQEGSVVFVTDGRTLVKLDAQGNLLNNPDQETLPC